MGKILAIDFRRRTRRPLPCFLATPRAYTLLMDPSTPSGKRAIQRAVELGLHPPEWEERAGGYQLPPFNIVARWGRYPSEATTLIFMTYGDGWYRPGIEHVCLPLEMY